MKISDFNKNIILANNDNTSSSINSAEIDNYALAEEQLDVGNYAEAIKYLSKALEKEPDNIFCLQKRSFCYYWLKDSKNAILDISKAINLAPYVPEFYIHRADCYAKAHQKDLATIDIEKAVSLNPEGAINLYMIGLLYNELHDDLKAIDYIKKSISVTAEDIDQIVHSYMALAAIYNFDLNDHNKALENINMALKKSTAESEYLDRLHTLKGIILYNLNRKPEALVEFDKALKINSSEPDALRYKKIITDNK